MIKLYTYRSSWEVPSASPFCIKLETYLKMAEIPYEVETNFDMRKAPKGKIPFVEHDGQLIGDTNLIIDHLKEVYGDKVDVHLNAEERAVVLAFHRLIEENLYWAGVFSRWAEEENWLIIKKEFFGGMPPLMQAFFPNLIRKKVLRDMKGQGLLLHKREEIYAIGGKDLSALSDFLGEKAFFLGDQPCSLDATAFGLLANLYWVPIDSPLREQAETFPNLQRFCERMRGRYYPVSQSAVSEPAV